MICIKISGVCSGKTDFGSGPPHGALASSYPTMRSAALLHGNSLPWCSALPWCQK